VRMFSTACNSVSIIWSPQLWKWRPSSFIFNQRNRPHKIWWCFFVGSIAKSRFQIKGSKNQYFHPAAWNSVHWLPMYANTTIYCCIAVLQLLYRWHKLSRKLSIPPCINISSKTWHTKYHSPLQDQVTHILEKC
jgi:hypothetical protein